MFTSLLTLSDPVVKNRSFFFSSYVKEWTISQKYLSIMLSFKLKNKKREEDNLLYDIRIFAPTSIIDCGGFQSIKIKVRTATDKLFDLFWSKYFDGTILTDKLKPFLESIKLLFDTICQHKLYIKIHKLMLVFICQLNVGAKWFQVTCIDMTKRLNVYLEVAIILCYNITLEV